MARLARAVFPGHPHHVTQRGNGRAQTFFVDQDYALYLRLLADHSRAAGVDVWAYVLMPNHVHLILTPRDVDGVRRALAPVHRRYAGHVHARLKRTGHFWQGRFGCVAMDEDHLGAAVRYIALNPVRAGLVDRPAGWRWSSVHAHLAGVDDGVTAIAPVRDRYPDFAAWIATPRIVMHRAGFGRRKRSGGQLETPPFSKDWSSKAGGHCCPPAVARNLEEISALSP